jgi:hypothetical protein
MLQYVTALGADVESADDIYVKGKISSIKYTYSAQYGTATYNISADGKEDNVFTVYGSYFFDNKPWEEGQTQIQVGDDVVVCGKAIYYKGTTPEFSNKKNWLVSLNGKTSEGGSATTGADGSTIISVADFNAAPESAVTASAPAVRSANSVFFMLLLLKNVMKPVSVLSTTVPVAQTYSFIGLIDYVSF